MSTPLRDPELLTLLLGRQVLRVEQETAMGMQRVLALHFEDGVQFPMPTGNALKSAGEVAEIRALLSGLPRQVAAAIRRRVGAGDPSAAADFIDATVTAALTDPDSFIDDSSGPTLIDEPIAADPVTDPAAAGTAAASSLPASAAGAGPALPVPPAAQR